MIFSKFPKISLGFYKGKPTVLLKDFKAVAEISRWKKISSPKIISSIENQKSLRNVCLSSYKVTLFKISSRLKKFEYYIFHWLAWQKVCNFFKARSAVYNRVSLISFVKWWSFDKKVANFQSMENMVSKLLQLRQKFIQSNFIGW